MEDKNKLEREIIQMKGILRQNLEYTKRALEISEKNSRYILWIKIVNLIKLLIIIIPIVLAIIYLPPYIQEFFNKYQELFGQGGFFMEYFK